MKMKRVLTLFLAVVLLISCIAPTANATESVPFSDVPPGSWYDEAVWFVYTYNLMIGTSSTKFSPNQKVTRAMLAQILYNASSKIIPPDHPTFKDVKPGSWYYDAVSWAAAKGITKGTSKTKFSPDLAITKEQALTFLYRFYADEADKNLDKSVINLYSDWENISKYARETYAWALKYHIIVGTYDNKLNPTEACTRAEIAMMLEQIYLYYKGGEYTKNKGQVSLNGKTIRLGMSKNELASLFGQPTEIRRSANRYSWFVYGTNNYNNFFLVGVDAGQVVAIWVENGNWSANGYKAGRCYSSVDDEHIIIDKNHGNKAIAYYACYQSFARSYPATNAIYENEAIIDSYLVNAFRVINGRSPLIRESRASTAARKHSVDMATNHYFNHYAPNGSDPAARLRAEGVYPKHYCENIAACSRGVTIAHATLVGSSGHNRNMLDGNVKYIGTGTAYGNVGDGNFRVVLTESYWR